MSTTEKQSYFKCKKQGTEYKKFNESKVKKDIDYRYEIDKLSKELVDKKAINKPLFKNIQSKIEKRTRKTTFDYYYNGLLQIQYINKIGKMSTNYRSMGYNAYTIKEFKNI